MTNQIIVSSFYTENLALPVRGAVRSRECVQAFGALKPTLVLDSELTPLTMTAKFKAQSYA